MEATAESSRYVHIVKFLLFKAQSSLLCDIRHVSHIQNLCLPKFWGKVFWIFCLVLHLGLHVFIRYLQDHRRVSHGSLTCKGFWMVSINEASGEKNLGLKFFWNFEFQRFPETDNISHFYRTISPQSLAGLSLYWILWITPFSCVWKFIKFRSPKFR